MPFNSSYFEAEQAPYDTSGLTSRARYCGGLDRECDQSLTLQTYSCLLPQGCVLVSRVLSDQYAYTLYMFHSLDAAAAISFVKWEESHFRAQGLFSVTMSVLTCYSGCPWSWKPGKSWKITSSGKSRKSHRNEKFS